MLVRAVSDLHGYLPEVEPCDLLLLAGDYFPIDDHSPAAQLDFISRQLAPWLRAIPANRVVAVSGNHDFIFQENPDLPAELHWDYLQDRSVAIGGLVIWGHPWTDMSSEWAFHASGQEMQRIVRQIPGVSDIVLTHGPPLGFGDMVVSGERVGCPYLAERTAEIKPRALVCGHIHEAAGHYRAAGTEIFNVSVKDEDYQVVREVTLVGDL